MQDNSQLTDVPKTMLWTLHNRANEAMRPDTILSDPYCVDIYRQIDVDYEKYFGKAEPSHAVRSMIFDEQISQFLHKFPQSPIINLGEGLETQRFRLQSNPNQVESLWYSIDLADAIAFRERYIQPDEKHIHLSQSFLQSDWMRSVGNKQPVIITAQGLLMYFNESQVKQFIHDMIEFFPSQSVLIFDTIPVWLSKQTLSDKGYNKTPHYTTPKMPWGIAPRNLRQFVNSCHGDIESIEIINYARKFPRGLSKWLYQGVSYLPFLKQKIPMIVKINW